MVLNREVLSHVMPHVYRLFELTTEISWRTGKNFYNNGDITHIAMDDNCEHMGKGRVYNGRK